MPTTLTDISRITPELRQKANEFVNMSFWATLLREFRQASEPTILDGGPGREPFTQLLAMEIVKRISTRGETPLAEALLKQLGGSRYAVRDLQSPAPLAEAAAALRWRGNTND